MYLIHYTDAQNLAQLKKTRALKCALSLEKKARKKVSMQDPRPETTPLSKAVVLRDQQPLLKHKRRENFPDYVEYLNGHVFFWPDSEEGEDSRKRFRNKYGYPGNIGLRVQLSSLQDANPEAVVLFSRYISGAKRKKPNLMLFKPLVRRNDKKLIEVVMKGEIHLPDDTEYESAKDKWQPLFSAAKPGAKSAKIAKKSKNPRGTKSAKT